MCGVTCSSTPVSMYCDVVVTTLVVLPTMRLLVDRDLVAGLDRRLLVVERGQVRIGDHLGVAVAVEQVQRRLDAAGEVRVVDDVVEALAIASPDLPPPCGTGDRGRERDRGVERRGTLPVDVAAGAAPRRRAALEQPVDAEVESSVSVTSTRS